MNTAIIKERQ